MAGAQDDLPLKRRSVVARKVAPTLHGLVVAQPPVQLDAHAKVLVFHIAVGHVTSRDDPALAYARWQSMVALHIAHITDLQQGVRSRGHVR